MRERIMSNPSVQREYYNRSRSHRLEDYVKNPSSLVGVYLPCGYSLPNRLIVKRISAFCEGDLSALRILDLGCGEGEFACYFASRGAEVTALDISEVNTEIAKLRATANSLPNVLTVVADCTDTHLPSGAFDVALGSALIHHLTANEESLLYEEVYRLLAPRGIAIFAESLQNSRLLEFLRTLVPIRQKHNPRPSRLSKSWKSHVSNDPHPARSNTTRHYQNVLRSTKFRSFELVELGIFSRLDRLTTNRRLRHCIHDFDHRLKAIIPLSGRLSRNVLITLLK
jgi:2-polyprenyl-3-methyl-5-hydroxy-6-metoxy-1,4-benzoquinol methylase